jgi:hypothetical protein
VFLDMDLESTGLDPSNFSRLRGRLVNTVMARRFLEEVVRQTGTGTRQSRTWIRVVLHPPDRARPDGPMRGVSDTLHIADMKPPLLAFSTVVTHRVPAGQIMAGGAA